MLAIAAVALATFAPSALAAEGQGDNAAKQPTMAELASKVDSLGTRLGALQTTLGSHTTKLDALSTTVAANHATIVGKFAQQTAVVTTRPIATSGHNATYRLVGDSSIAGFPKGTLATNRQFTDRALPTGTYLFEVQQPYSDNVLCNGKVSISLLGGIPARHYSVCPRMVVTILDRGGSRATSSTMVSASTTLPRSRRATSVSRTSSHPALRLPTPSRWIPTVPRSGLRSSSRQPPGFSDPSKGKDNKAAGGSSLTRLAKILQPHGFKGGRLDHWVLSAAAALPFTATSCAVSSGGGRVRRGPSCRGRTPGCPSRSSAARRCPP